MRRRASAGCSAGTRAGTGSRPVGYQPTHMATDLATLTPEQKLERDRQFERDALPWLDDVYRFALSLTRDEADAEDVVQETFLRAYRSWHTFIPGTDCRRWLFTICRNVFLRSQIGRASCRERV